jgi:hypothetical protein
LHDALAGQYVYGHPQGFATVNAAVALFDSQPLAVTLKFHVANDAVEAAVNARVALCPALNVEGLTLADTSAGSPETEQQEISCGVPGVAVDTV